MGMTHTIQDNFLSFQTANQADIKSLKVNFSPVQDTTSQPTPDNIVPISGFSSIETKMLQEPTPILPKQPQDAYYSTNNKYRLQYMGNGKFKLLDTISAGDVPIFDINIIPITWTSNINSLFAVSTIKEKIGQFNLTYSLRSTITSDKINGYFEFSATSQCFAVFNITDSTFIGKVFNSFRIIFTDVIPINAEFAFVLGNQQNIISYTTNFSELEEENNILYGGQIDLVDGSITKIYHKVVLDGSITPQYQGTEGGYSRFRIHRNTFNFPPKTAGTTSIFCDSLAIVQDGTPHAWSIWSVGSTSNYFIIYTPTTYNSDSSFAAYLKEHPITFVYRMNQPTVIGSLSAQQIKTFMKSNYIWSNANDSMELEYEINDSADILSAKKKIIANTPHLETKKDTAVSFKTDIIAPLKKSIINFSPIQEINLYKEYWMGGENKNKLGFANVTDVSNGTNRTITCSRNEIIIKGTGTVYTNAIIAYQFMINYCRPTTIPAGTYTFSISDLMTNVADVDKANIRLILSGENIDPVVFDGETTTLTEPCNVLGISYTSQLTWQNGSYMILKIQLEEGSSVTSWVPYENLYPIDGWTGVSLISHESNIKLIPDNFTSYTHPDGEFKYLGNNTFELTGLLSAGLAVTIPVQSFTLYQNIAYTCVLIRDPGSGMLDGYTEFGFQLKEGNKNVLLVRPNGGWNNNIFIGTVTLNRDYVVDNIKFGVTTGNANFKMQVLLFNDSITTIPISWESTLGTIYGGYIDLASGKLVQTHYKVTFDGTEQIQSTFSAPGDQYIRVQFMSNNNPKIQQGLKLLQQNPTSCKYSHGKYEMSKTIDVNKGGVASNSSGTATILILHLPLELYVSGNIITDVKNYLASQYNNGTPVELCYELATPIEYNLTPQQLKTLKGTNNIWSNANGPTEVTYWTH